MGCGDFRQSKRAPFDKRCRGITLTKILTKTNEISTKTNEISTKTSENNRKTNENH